MTGFLAIAPLSLPFTLVPGAALRDPEDYAAFWADVENRTGDERLTFTHAEGSAQGIRYRSLSEDDLAAPLDIIRGSIGHAALTSILAPVGEAEPGTPAVGAQSLTFRLYDHSTVVVEMAGDVDTSGILAGGSAGERTLATEAVQGAIIEAVSRAAESVLADTLVPALDLAQGIDRRGRFVEWERPSVALRPDWVARGLVIPLDAPDRDALVWAWLADVETAEVIDDVASGTMDHCARWLTYIYSGAGPDALTDSSRSAWRAMRYAQYFYSALDHVDGDLNRVLAETTAGRRRSEVEELTATLSALSARAERVMLDLQDLRKYVTRPVRAELDGILDAWSYGDLIEEPVTFKIGICDRRLTALNAESQARSGAVTDAILMGIGVTSVLATALALTDFGRSLAADPTQAQFGTGRSAITEWFAAQSADSILAGSVAISVLLVVLFLAVRRGPGA